MKRCVLLLALGACADPAIEMSLKMPAANQMPAGYDLSCITTVEVLAVGNERGGPSAPPDTVGDCVDLGKAPASFADIRAAIAGKFDLTIPESGLAGIALRGTTGACADKNRLYEANFYGGTAYSDGSESVTIPVIPNISCNARKTYAVSTIDMLALASTKLCAMSLPDPTAQPLVFSGDIRPQLLGNQFDRMVWEDGASAAVPNADGKATIDSFSGVVAAKSCVALGFASGKGMAGSCINPSAPTLCAAQGELELPVIDDIYAAASIETPLVQEYGQPVFGVVYKQTPITIPQKTPYAGATVELEDPTQGKVVYVAPGTSKLNPLAGATATDASGFFIIYMKGEATGVIVKAGASQQRYTVASQGALPPTLLAVLP